MSKLKFKIVTPERVTYEDTIDEVIIPTLAGQITILAHHKPLVAVLKPGELIVKKDTSTIYLAVSTGLVEMRPANELIILADTAEHAEELNLEEIAIARKRAEDLLKNKHDMEDVEFARTEALLERELARFRVAEQYRKRRK